MYTSLGCALHYAVLGGSKECLFTVMRFLLRYHNAVSLGSNLTSKLSELINWRDEREDTPGMLLCKLYTMEEFNQNKGHYSYKKNRIYEDVSTRIQSSTAASNSPTNSSISTERKYEFMKINRTMSQILRALLFFGCDVSLTNSANQTMLMMACKHGHLNLVQTLLRQRHRSHNLTAPSSSAHMTQIAQMKALPFARDIEGNSSLFYSLIEGHTAVSELLIRRQLFSLMDTNNEGNNAFHILALHSQLSSNINDIASMLIAQERKEWTSYIKDSQSVSVLINMFTRPKLLFSINVVGKRPIDIAIEKGNVKYAQLLCEAATDIYGVSLYPRLARDRQLISEIDRKPQLTPEIRPPAEQVSDPTVNPTISNSKDEIAKDTIDKEGRVLVMSEGVLEPDSCDIDCHIPPTMASSPVEVSSGDSSSPSLTPEVISIENNINDEDVVQESKVKCPSESQDDETMNIEVDVNIHAYMIRRKSRRMLRALEQAFRDPLAFLGARSSKTSQQQVPALIPQQEAQISLPSLTQLGHSIIVDESCAATNSVDLISDIDRCDDEAENDSERELAETLAYNLALQPEPRNLGYLGRFSGPLRDMYGNSGGESDPGVDVSMKDKSEVTTGVFITEPTEISINRQVIIPILSIEGEEKE